MSSLPMVEVLLHEFYQPATPNSRKKDIESELLSFKSQPDAWQICLQVATTFEGNQFLWFFATSTLEHTITRRWGHLTTPDRELLREQLWTTYANLDPIKVPRRQRDTIAQLMAIMAKREFPDNHPMYMCHCLELVKNKFPLGICLLRTTSEEITSGREDVNSDRRNYFMSCVQMCVPETMDLLTKYLLIVVCYINDRDIHSLPQSLMDFSLLSSLPKDNHLSTSILDLLQCCQHLVSWIRTDYITEYFILSILDLSAWRSQHEEICSAAVSVLNEMFYLQKPLPYVNTIMNGVNGLLEQHNNVEQQSEIYCDKFRELLSLFANKYWQKLLQESNLLDAFLKSLYCCTLQKNGSLDFSEKLEIWTPILKGLINTSKLEAYNDIVHKLVGEIMQRILYEYNKTELELLDNEIIDWSSQTTELHQYLAQCIECIALIASAQPNAVFRDIYKYWSGPHVEMLSLEYAIVHGKHSDIARKFQCPKLSETMKDFSTICQAIVRVAPLLITGNTEAVFEGNNYLIDLTDKLIAMLRFFVTNKVMSVEADRSSFQSDFDYLYSQILIGLKKILLISPSVKSDKLINNLYESLGSIFLTNNINLASMIYLAASELLLFLSSVIRPRCILETSAIVNLMRTGPDWGHLPRQVVANIYISLISYLVLPWKNVDDQDYARRTAVLKEYVESIAQLFLDLDPAAGETKVAVVTLNLLDNLSTVIDFFRDSSNNVKQILASIMESIISKALIIYNNYGPNSNPIAITVADFSLSILRSLQTQLGASLTKDIVYLFITVSSREHFSASRLAVIEKVLLMFQLIVEQPGSTSMTMLPSILDFTIDHILPLLQQDNNFVNKSEISSLVYSLFDSVLTCKWQYFYKSQVQQHGSMASPTNGIQGENLHPGHFMAIMNAYGQILVSGNDPSNVRSVLYSMQQVNDRWRLYQRNLFKDHLLLSFQKAVINLLVSGEGTLHEDILSTTLYSLGQADMIKLKHCLTEINPQPTQKHIEETCQATDIPTFTHKLSQLVRDVHCAHLAHLT